MLLVGEIAKVPCDDALRWNHIALAGGCTFRERIVEFHLGAYKHQSNAVGKVWFLQLLAKCVDDPRRFIAGAIAAYGAKHTGRMPLARGDIDSKAALRYR